MGYAFNLKVQSYLTETFPWPSKSPGQRRQVQRRVSHGGQKSVRIPMWIPPSGTSKQVWPPPYQPGHCVISPLDCFLQNRSPHPCSLSPHLRSGGTAAAGSLPSTDSPAPPSSRTQQVPQDLPSGFWDEARHLPILPHLPPNGSTEYVRQHLPVWEPLPWEPGATQIPTWIWAPHSSEVRAGGSSHWGNIFPSNSPREVCPG